MAECIHLNWPNAQPERSRLAVRPAVVFGRGEGDHFAQMAGLLKKGVSCVPSRRDTIRSSVYVGNLLDLIETGRADVAVMGRLITNGAYPECPTLGEILGQLRSSYFLRALLIDVPPNLLKAAITRLGALNELGMGFHPDRVEKRLKSTHVYPGWAAEKGLLPEPSFKADLDQWAASTGGEFV